MSDRSMGTKTTSFWRTALPPGAAHHEHIHRRANEIFYLICGRGIHGVGDRGYPVRTGDVFFIPRGPVQRERSGRPLAGRGGGAGGGREKGGLAPGGPPLCRRLRRAAERNGVP